MISYKRLYSVLLLVVLFVVGSVGCSIKNNDNDSLVGGIITEALPYVIFGYHVLDGAYFNHDDVRTTPILDYDKIKDSNQTKINIIINKINVNQSKITVHSGNTARELLNSISGNASAQYQGIAFSGKIKTEYQRSIERKEHFTYVKSIYSHIVEEEYISGLEKNLVYVLSDDFLDAIEELNIDDSDTMGNMFYIFGTHLIKKAYKGGHLEFNYQYRGTSFNDESSLKLHAEASARVYSGSVDGEYKRKAKYLEENSITTIQTAGGEPYEDYQQWIRTIGKKPTIMGNGENFEDFLIPIWRLVKLVDVNKGEALENHFAELVKDRLADIKELDKYLEKMYVSNIMVYTDKDADKALKDAKSDSRNRVVQFSPGSPWGHADMNKGAGGDYVYVAYQFSSNPNDAIAEILLFRSSSSQIEIPSGWNKVNMDLNKGAGGDYIYIIYRKVNKYDKEAVKEIAAVYGTGFSLSTDKGWKWVNWYGSNEKADANKSVGGEFVFLTTRKSKWSPESTR